MKNLNLFLLFCLVFVLSCSGGHECKGVDCPCVGTACPGISKVETPVFINHADGTSLADGSNVPAGTLLEIKTETEDAKIKYTTNGDNPLESGLQYSGPIATNNAVTVKAIATKETWDNSEIFSASYTITSINQIPLAPTFSPSPGSMIEKTSPIHINVSTSGAKINYTTDGVTTPTASSGNLYNNNTPITIANATTIKAIAYMPDGSLTPSNVSNASYTIMKAPVPNIATENARPNGSIVCPSDSLLITPSLTLGGLVVKYNTTIDGTNPADPNESSSQYSGPISFSSYQGHTVKISSKVFKSNRDPSNTSSAYYEVMSPSSLAKPVITCSGTLNGPKTVTISYPDVPQQCVGLLSGSNIMYNSSANIIENPYTQSFQVTETTTINARLQKTSFPPAASAVASKTCCVGSSCLIEAESGLGHQ